MLPVHFHFRLYLLIVNIHKIWCWMFFKRYFIRKVHSSWRGRTRLDVITTKILYLHRMNQYGVVMCSERRHSIQFSFPDTHTALEFSVPCEWRLVGNICDRRKQEIRYVLFSEDLWLLIKLLNRALIPTPAVNLESCHNFHIMITFIRWLRMENRIVKT